MTDRENSLDSLNHEVGMSQISITIASVPDREDPVAELWYGDEMWGEVRHERGNFQLELYPRPNGGSWNFDLQRVLDTFQDARARLSA